MSLRHDRVVTIKSQRRGLTRFQLPKGFLGLRIIDCRNSSDILEWGHTDRKHHTHCSLTSVSPDWIHLRLKQLFFRYYDNYLFRTICLDINGFYDFNISGKAKSKNLNEIENYKLSNLFLNTLKKTLELVQYGFEHFYQSSSK